MFFYNLFRQIPLLLMIMYFILFEFFYDPALLLGNLSKKPFVRRNEFLNSLFSFATCSTK